MTQQVSPGVAKLIDRLKHEGIEAGKQRADKLINDAHKQAGIILEAAIQEADKIMTESKATAENELTAGKQALNLAARDMILEFRAQMTIKFKEETKRLVSECMATKEIIYKLLLLICSNSLQELGEVDLNGTKITLGADILDIATTVQEPETATTDVFKQLALNISGQMLAKGVSFDSKNAVNKGMQIKVEQGNVLLDFSDEALAAELSKHLQPRFRALLEGLIQK